MGGCFVLFCFDVVLGTEPRASSKVVSHSSTEVATVLPAQELTRGWAGNRRYASIKQIEHPATNKEVRVKSSNPKSKEKEHYLLLETARRGSIHPKS